MAFGVFTGSAVRRSEAKKWAIGGLPRAIVRRVRQRAFTVTRQRAFPELDCVRKLLPRRVILAAERRARSIGLGADRVLIGADAITEEAYLDALAASLGTSYEPLDGVARADCPLDDRQLIQAAAAGLLPLRQGDALTWIVAPRCLTARRLADPRRAGPQWLRPFRLTSGERLRRFVAKHTQSELGRRAADGLHLARPLFSNAPPAYGAWRPATIALAMLAALAAAALAFAAATTPALGVALCTVFLTAAALRLASVVVAPQAPDRSIRINDHQLPIYTIICALYREAAVVNDLVAAIRALDYPGIMAQTPQDFRR